MKLPGTDFRSGEIRTVPSSLGQQSLWLIDQWQPNSSLYNIGGSLRIQGHLDVTALEKALHEVVRRHEVLRTTLTLGEGQVVQVIHPEICVPLKVVSLESYPESERPGEVNKRATAHIRQPFDLSQGPLLRILLLRSDPCLHELVVSVHHSVADGWSTNVLFAEWGKLYDGIRAGNASRMPDLPIQYADFAVQQRRELQGPRLQQLLKYWRQQLRDLTRLELPTDRPRPLQRSDGGADVRCTLPTALLAALQALSRRERATLFMTLLAAFNVLLHHWTGQTDIALGTPIAGRDRVEVEGSIGFFMNVLVLRSDLGGNPTFSELLQRVRETALSAIDHQQLAFGKLVEELRPPRLSTHAPLFDVMINFMALPPRPIRLSGLTVTMCPPEVCTAKYDLTLSLDACPEGLRVLLEYSTDLFDRSTVERMLGHFQILLRSIIADPGRRLDELELLTPVEYQQLTRLWNDTRTAYPRDATIHELFEAQVERSPDVVAVRYDGRGATYRELNRRANQLAAYLRRRGVGPEVAVAVCLTPSVDMIVSWLGILKAGGAYVPLDRNNPPERQHSIVKNARAPVLVTDDAGRRTWSAAGTHVICLSEESTAIAHESPENTPTPCRADELAYIIHTSGSTGGPKGVAVPHRAVVRLVVGTNYVTLGPGDVLAQASNVAFDAATFEIWGALLNGSRLVGLARETLLAPDSLSAELRQQGITILFLTTGLFHHLAQDAPSIFAPVHTLLVGGEALDARIASTVLTADAPRRLMNIYGPTEATTFSAWDLVEPGSFSDHNAPIGRPIANTTLHILDKSLRLVPIGVVGEICIGGDGLARGYVGEAGLTADKFVADPFNTEPGARLYRTGDLGRRLSDGRIQMLGRHDGQVKIRGFRVEVGEIETILGRYPRIKEVVVLAREDVPGQKQLVAYVVPHRQEATPTVGELRAYLKEKLPDYMVPASFLTLNELPLTPNCKVDRKKLPAPNSNQPQFNLTPNGKVDRKRIAAPDSGRPQSDHACAHPRAPIEELLSAIWAEVLNLQTVGIDDDFFELGGHSLLAMKLFSRIEESVGKKLPLATVFEHSTIARLARLLQQPKVLAKNGSLVKIQGEGSRQPLFFAPSSGGEHFFCKPILRYLGPDQPIWSFQIPEEDGLKKPFRDIESMAAFFVGELTQYQIPEPYCLAGYSFGAAVALEMAQQLWANGKQVTLLAILDLGFALPRPRTIASLLGSAWASLCNVPYWLVDDFLRTPWKQRYARSLSEMREVGRRLREPWGDALQISATDDAWPGSLGTDYRALTEAHLRALAQYKPRPYPGRVTLFRSRASGLLASSREHDYGWSRIATGGVDVKVIPGSHFTMVQEPFARILAHELRRALDRAESMESAFRVGRRQQPQG